MLDETAKNCNCKTQEVSECAAENYGGDDNPERVYSVLEDENPESDYLTILPESSEYERPINPPVSDS